MRSVNLIILLTFVAQAHSIEVKVNHIGDVQDSISKLVDELVNRLFKASHLKHADLDKTTLGKLGHLVISHTTLKASIPRFIPLQRRSQNTHGLLRPSQPRPGATAGLPDPYNASGGQSSSDVSSQVTEDVTLGQSLVDWDSDDEVLLDNLGPKPPKSYKNTRFLNSPEARMIRIMCELQHPGQQLEKEGVENIVMFFGSARAKSRAEYEEAVAEAQARVDKDPDDEPKRHELERLQKMAFLVPCYETTRDLADKLTRWNIERQPGTRNFKPTYTVGTGGGPGMMAAANEGARTAGGKSCGFGISLPFEDRLNPYCSPELSFEFHYFFTRKFWMAYKIMGLVVAPGGLGTCDELFEVLTLMQTGRIKRALPVVLIGKKFWQDCINFEAFVDYGMISQQDYESLRFADTAEEAFNILKEGIEMLEREGDGAFRSKWRERPSQR